MDYSASNSSGNKRVDQTQRLSAPHVHPNGSARCRGWRSWLLGLGALLLSATSGLNAKEFTIHEVEAEFGQDSLSVQARIELSLSDEVIEALHNGIPITLSTVIEMERIRRFFPDAPLSEWRFDYDLSYHGLSHRYVLDTPFNDTPASFSQLQSALNRIGDFQFHTELVTETLPESEHGYSFSLKTEIDLNALPAPLRLIALIRPSWRLNSKPFRWHEPN